MEEFMIPVFLEVTLQGYLPGAKLNSETLLASNTHIFVGDKLMISNISLDILEIFLFFSKNSEFRDNLFLLFRPGFQLYI